MRIVVIGGSGHIGTFLVPRLVRAGHDVISVTRSGGTGDGARLHQVVSNQESLRLQYALRQRARELGWHEADIDVIDADLAKGLPEGLPDPDAVFIGGGATKALVNQCRPRLPIGGRLVVHGVTMEAEMLVETLHCDLGGDLIRFGVETADVIGRLHGWKPARTVVAWTWQRTE